LLFYDSIMEALNETPRLLTHLPLALEMIDSHILSAGRTSPQLRGKLEWLPASAKAMLIVEMEGKTPEKVINSIEQIKLQLATNQRSACSLLVLAKDFDEASLAPAIWEITRMLTSIFVGFDSLSIPLNEAKKAASLFLTVYAETLTNGKPKYIEPETSKGIVKSFLKAVASRKQKELIRQRTIQKNGKLQFVIDNTHLYKIDPKLKRDLTSALNLWLKKNLDKQYGFKIHDAAFRIAGTGSLGVKRYVFITEKMKGQKKYLLIDMKQALASSLKPWLHTAQPNWKSEAERVISTQHWMQNVSPAFLNTMIFKNEDFVLKEMQPLADKINFQLIKKKPANIERVISDMAMLTASAQLRSSGRQGSTIADELVAFGKDKSWQKNTLQYAYDYSKQVKKDYIQFQKAYQKNYFSNP